jgi:hypothetical protein
MAQTKNLSLVNSPQNSPATDTKDHDMPPQDSASNTNINKSNPKTTLTILTYRVQLTFGLGHI